MNISQVDPFYAKYVSVDVVYIYKIQIILKTRQEN